MEKTYYPINEETARRAQQAFSFSDYTPGSATREYQAAVDEIWDLVEEREAKGDLTPGQIEKIQQYADRYARRYADWQNRMNANTASCPSVMISGGSNFPVGKKEKQIAREDKLWAEYEELQKYAGWIENYGESSNAIMTGDADAVERLEARIKELTDKQAKMKAANAYWRKNGTMKGYNGLTDEEATKLDGEIKNSYSWCQQPYPGYMLTNNNGNINRLRQRLTGLQREKATEGRQYDTAGLNLTVKENKAIMRLQVFFPDKPDEKTRELLKAHAYKWAPSQKAWQRVLSNSARVDLEMLLKKLKEVTRNECE